MDNVVSLKQKAYQYIKTRIVDCDYPPNAFLNEKQLMADIQVSRTPIREALSKLEQENLVSILPNRGVTVKSLSAVEINMMFQTRELIETYIVQKDGGQIDKNLLMHMKEQMDQDLQAFDLSENSTLDDEFHKMLMSGSKNTYLLQVLDHMYIQLHRLRVMNGQRNMGRLQLSHQEHRAIVDRLISGDYQGAAEAVRIHLANARDAAMDLLISS
ncbi:MAG: GntR family transcriptional regulator [Treponemataceae bacterium]